MFTPSKKVLEKYADVLINFALNNGKGIKKGDVVFLHVPESAKFLLKYLRIAVLKARGYPITYQPEGLIRDFLSMQMTTRLNSFLRNFYEEKLIKWINMLE